MLGTFFLCFKTKKSQSLPFMDVSTLEMSATLLHLDKLDEEMTICEEDGQSEEQPVF